ncbi:protein lifeguard 3 isoform X2 [Denticeps clupeoides]|uniref:protein lifeguard 3 isoform X2 n=1 Tax=Denticeps clupeoides TaxID=299321 RepID=UPI0010A319D7|nr:protein lifeguard 3-like isoform X2 [Denticeps clupeoides]XP_028847300.1 protein lifeguard 3-like isoform X2 [Denticeps clupeoides]
MATTHSPLGTDSRPTASRHSRRCPTQSSRACSHRPQSATAPPSTAPGCRPSSPRTGPPECPVPARAQATRRDLHLLAPGTAEPFDTPSSKNDPVRSFVVQNPAVYWASFAIYFVTYIVLVCCEKPRRVFPWNLILLCVFTLAMSYMTGTISSYYDTKAVFLALLITAVVCVIVTVFCFQTKVDFTSCTGLFCVLAMVFLVIGIVTAIVLSFQYVPWLHMLYAAIGAIVYTLFLAYHTQLLMGNRAYALSPEEYIYGALALYVDIVQIFMFLVQITGASSE